jgi:hypothetical protein
MYDVSDDLLSILRSRSRDLSCVYELYEWNYELFPEPLDGNLSYDPRHALARWAGSSLSFTWGAETIDYIRVITDGPSIKKSKGKHCDSVSLTCSNIKQDDDGRRYLARFVLTNRLPGMRLVVRVIPRSASSLSVIEASASPFTHSVIWFVGRCEKPNDFDRASGTITAKQDIGTIAAQIPERDLQPSCPLKFKKGDCLGDQTLSQKTATYQAAKVCNKTEAQCIEYGNEKYFQGTQVVQIESSFLHKHNESFFKKVLNILPGISRKKTTVDNSTYNTTPYGQPVPVVLGRWLHRLFTIQYKDAGETIWFKKGACRGPIKDFVTLKNESPNFSQPLEVVKHLGEYGDVGTQTQDLVFPGGEYHSKLAYVTGRCIGSDIVVSDPAPDITSLIAGQKVKVCTGISAGETLGTGRVDSVFAGYAGGENWTDNPVDLAVHVITDPAYLNLPLAHVGQHETAITSAYTMGAVKDVSSAERCLLPDTEIAHAGVDYKRFNSTGLIGPLSFFGTDDFLFQPQRPGGYWAREALYEFFDPDSPPTSLDVVTRYRKRYTAGVVLTDKKKAVDFLYDTLYTSFRGFTRWDRHGRLVVDCERPVDHSFLRVDAIAGATSIKLLDVTPWKRLEGALDGRDELRGKILIGVHKPASEVRPVNSSSYSADGNGIPYSANSTSATMTATAIGASLSGGSVSVAASGSVEIAGSCSVGDEISITIDGFTVSITATQEDVDASIDNLTVACQLVCAINAEPKLNEYIEAWRSGSNPTTVQIFCKFGVLNFTTPLEEDHFAELDDPVTAPTLASSTGILAAGAYLVAYAYRNANGNTNVSNIGAITILANKQIDVTGVSLPAGADSIDWFVSVEANSDLMLLVHNNNGTGFSINSLPAVTAEHAPKLNTTGEEILRVMYSDAQRALAYADTTRATHLDGSFGWPEGGRQSLINQVKGTYREAIQDFAEQPLTINDERHQDEVGEINSTTIDLSAVDNFNQASRLLNGYLAKFRDLDFFFNWSAAGEPLLLEIGDLVCLSDDSGEWRNVPVTIEDINYNQKFEASFTCRLYSTSAFDDAVLQTQVPLPSGLINYLGEAPALEFDTVTFPPDGLEQGNDGIGGVSTIVGGIIFGGTYYSGQYAIVYVTKPESSQEIANAKVIPDDTLHGTFEILAATPGVYEVCLQAVSGFEVKSEIGPCATVAIGLGAAQGEWITPMVQFSGTAGVGPSGSGTYTIP